MNIFICALGSYVSKLLVVSLFLIRYQDSTIFIEINVEALQNPLCDT